MQRVLIADDDPVSLRFLAAAVSQLGGDAVAVADGVAALVAAKRQSFDLMLLDRRMPGLGGADLLLALRAAGNITPAIATSAEIDAAIAAQLDSAGFVDIIEKPATWATLERALGPYLCASAGPLADAAVSETATPLLDDGAALTAIGGDASALRALRSLLAQELSEVPSQAASVDPCTHPAFWRERLHRLRASCGFCGATAMADAAVRLDCALRDDPGNSQTVLHDFLHLCRTTLSALHDQAPSATDAGLTSPSIPQARKPAPSR
jgi:two-component system OmpR family response regulator